jgi:Mg-chelatase subunit ChlD
MHLEQTNHSEETTEVLFRMYKLVLMIMMFFANATLTNGQLTPNQHDFGKIKLWNNPKATFTYTNNTSQRQMFLPIRYKRDIYLHLPEGYIEPGQSATIEAVYYTEERGTFSIAQPLYLSGSPTAINLKMRGRILSFHPDAKTVCPTIEHKDNPTPKATTTTITVYDKKTGLVINGVNILLVGASTNYFVEHTRKPKLPLKGIPIGLYQLDISKEGYSPLQHIQYISKNGNNLVFELEPLVGIEPTPIPEPEIVMDDRIIEIEKPSESDQDAIERIRKMMDERFRGRRIIEKDVLVLKEGDSAKIDEVTIVESEPVPTIPEKILDDFDKSGKLNSEKYASNNVVFLIDVSGSMKIDDKLESMKVSMKSLVEVLREEDLVTIVIYSTKARIVLTSTSGEKRDKINEVIDGLIANGSSRGAEGLSMAYNFALQNYIPKGNNQIILASDGLFNSREMTEKDIYEMANIHLSKHVSTSVVGFGKREQAREFMNTLADSGGGNYIHIKDLQEAQSALIAEIMHNAVKL